MPSVKNIGKPCAGKPHARFDEEGLVKLTMEWLLRHRQTKGAETDKQLLMAIESQFFTLPKGSFEKPNVQIEGLRAFAQSLSNAGLDEAAIAEKCSPSV